MGNTGSQNAEIEGLTKIITQSLSKALATDTTPSPDVSFIPELSITALSDSNKFKFGERRAPQAVVTPNRLGLSRRGYAGWRGALMDPPVHTTKRSYVEFFLEAHSNRVGRTTEIVMDIWLGVTALSACPDGCSDQPPMHQSAHSHMYCCHDSAVWSGGKRGRRVGPVGPPPGTSRRQPGDRVGLLVEDGCLYLCINGVRVPGPPLAAGLPPVVRFAAELGNDECVLNVLQDALPPCGGPAAGAAKAA